MGGAEGDEGMTMGEDTPCKKQMGGPTTSNIHGTDGTDGNNGTRIVIYFEPSSHDNPSNW